MKNPGETAFCGAEGVDALNSQAKGSDLDGALESADHTRAPKKQPRLSGGIFQVKKQKAYKQNIYTPVLFGYYYT